MRIAREEIFGPEAAVIKVKDYLEALATANDSEFGLSAGIVTISLKHATHFKRRRGRYGDGQCADRGR
ncbi:acyl-CoA reductase-like NAD-dependent aldehyde dehydrogenase [Devosia subaequoris]|uniref:Acyl-CoA reductase-like NAD-dependent aldehyde dehydrogenase n=1 Tax=Devosia subaequoris TaxID=395930 RepID=A0A7W6INX6_9HYPH|nr:acyl-CoA reductase-like NAD-dependent aldehyde dehydrogenase [Devosia subaequoris]